MTFAGRPRDDAERARAASDFKTNLVVSAGAGTGKTSLLVERILTAIGSGAAPLHAIAAITFTEKAAGELKHRLSGGLRLLRELAEGKPGKGAATPAGSAFARLREAGHAAVDLARRAADAEASLDRATVSTMHGLCSDILRAYPLDSGLPPGFIADRGLAGRRLAAGAWTVFVESELGPTGARADLWKHVLSRFDLGTLAEIARALAGGAIGDAALAAEHRVCDLRRVLGADARALAEAIESALATPGLTPAPREWLEEALRALARFLESGVAAGRDAIEHSARIPDPMPKLGTKVGPADAARVEAVALHAARLLRGLADADEQLEAKLFALLLPFARILRAKQTRSGLIDFDGLLSRVRDLLRDVPQVRAALKRRFAMILVDEFQDTDPIQYEIVFFLAERADEEAGNAYATQPTPGKLFIVGDAKQSIYRFRGADFAAYRRAVDHVLGHGGEELTLTSNFRSTPAVLDAVNALFSPPGAVWRASDYQPPYVPIDAERAADGADAVEIWTTPESATLAAAGRRSAEGAALAAELSRLAGPGAPMRYDDVLVLFRGMTEIAPYLRALREAGIPFVISGGRTFFTRTEVVQAMAVLRAVADPDDPVALLAYRRSPAGGVPDTELAAAASGGADTPALAAADSRLSALRDEVRRLPVDAAVRHVLHASGLSTLSGLAFEAAQRVANLEKLALAANELARDGRRDLVETLDALEEGFESDEEADSPLADVDRDAVRVMSIHKAKGLEARLVILADAAAGRAPRQERKAVASLARFKTEELVSLKSPRFRNAAAIAESLENAFHERAEDIRLLYVALTRARDRLIVFGGGKERTAWTAALDGWTGNVGRRMIVEPPARVKQTEVPIGAPEAAARYEAAARAVAARTVPLFAAPSGTAEAVGVLPAHAPGLAPELARDIGRIVHARLAGVGSGESIPEAAGEILRAFAASPLAARLAGASVLGREVPMLLSEEGARWQGSIDLLVSEPDGTVLAVDFKTDATDDGAVLRHGEQLRLYARAVSRAMPGRRVRAELWMLRSGRAIEVPVS